MLLEKLHSELIFSHVPFQRLVAILLRQLTQRAVFYHEYEITWDHIKDAVTPVRISRHCYPYCHAARSDSTRAFSYLQVLLATSFGELLLCVHDLFSDCMIDLILAFVQYIHILPRAAGVDRSHITIRILFSIMNLLILFTFGPSIFRTI